MILTHDGKYLHSSLYSFPFSGTSRGEQNLYMGVNVAFTQISLSSGYEAKSLRKISKTQLKISE